MRAEGDDFVCEHEACPTGVKAFFKCNAVAKLHYGRYLCEKHYMSCCSPLNASDLPSMYKTRILHAGLEELFGVDRKESP